MFGFQRNSVLGVPLYIINRLKHDLFNIDLVIVCRHNYPSVLPWADMEMVIF